MATEESVKPKGFVGFYEVRITNDDGKLHEIRFIHAKDDKEAQKRNPAMEGFEYV